MTYDYNSLMKFGNDVYISPNVEIKRPQLISIGNHVAIDSYFYITTGAHLGDYIHWSNGKRKADEFDLSRNEFFEQDKATFEKRKALGFPNDFEPVI